MKKRNPNGFVSRLASGVRYALAACVLAGGLSAALAAPAAAMIPATWTFVGLNSSGDANWNLSYPAGEAVEKYEITLARQKNGAWDTSYKTYKTSDDSYNISFASTGKYYITVKAKFVGGEYSAVSAPSNTVVVTSDDIRDLDVDDGIGSYYTGYGPGNPPPANQAQQPGPGSSIPKSKVINTVTGEGMVQANPYWNSSTAQTTVAAPSGWERVNGGYRYRYGNGTYAKSAWDKIDGNWYYFDANGMMHVGWLYLNDKWYYCRPSGKMAAGSWENVNEKWYYFNEAGIMQTGYISVNGKMYWTDGSGARVQSGFNPDGHKFDHEGIMIQ